MFQEHMISNTSTNIRHNSQAQGICDVAGEEAHVDGAITEDMVV